MTGLIKRITAGTSSIGFNTGSEKHTLNDPLSSMEDKEGQVKIVHGGQQGGDRDKKLFQSCFKPTPWLHPYEKSL